MCNPSELPSASLSDTDLCTRSKHVITNGVNGFSYSLNYLKSICSLFVFASFLPQTRTFLQPEPSVVNPVCEYHFSDSLQTKINQVNAYHLKTITF